MKSDQELISESRNLLSLITNEPNASKCRQYIEEFIEKYETWPSLSRVITALDSKRNDNKKNLSKLEKKALKEIQRTFDRLIKECERKKVNIPQSIIDAYEQKTISSTGYTVSRFDAVRNLIFLLKDMRELSAIKNFVIIDPKGYIDSCVFTPSYFEWRQARDAAKNSAWYCYDQIVYLINNSSTLLFIEDYPFNDENLSELHIQIQRAGSIMLMMDQREIMAEYKLCVKTVHEYAVSILLDKEKTADSYNKNTGLLVKDTIKIIFKPDHLRGKVLTLLHPKGVQRSTPLPFDEIYDKAIRSEADLCWDNLETAERTKIKKQIFEIYEGINDRVSKKTNKPYLSAEDLTLHFV
jgi:hypothetical protein